MKCPLNAGIYSVQAAACNSLAQVTKKPDSYIHFLYLCVLYLAGLSKWVRSKVQTFDGFSDFTDTLESFTEQMEKEMPVVRYVLGLITKFGTVYFTVP